MINLEDLTRVPSEFELSIGKKFKLRPCSLADESWMQRTFGKELEAIFKEIRLDEICRIAFHMMETDSKAELSPRERREVDENGVESIVKIGGVALFKTLIVDTKDKMAVLQSLLETIGISRPVQDQLLADQQEKKNHLIGQ